jgi:hypothetical protein
MAYFTVAHTDEFTVNAATSDFSCRAIDRQAARNINGISLLEAKKRGAIGTSFGEHC